MGRNIRCGPFCSNNGGFPSVAYWVNFGANQDYLNALYLC